MTKHQVEELVSRWLEEALDEAEDARIMQGRLSDATIDNAHVGLDELLDYSYEALIDGNYSNVTIEADELLQAASLPALNHSSPEFARLCRRLLRARIEYAKIELDRWDGIYSETRQGNQHGVSSRPPATSDVGATKPVDSLPCTTVIDKYLVAVPRPARTAAPLKAELRRFVVYIGGDKPIASVTKADCVRYKEYLMTTRGLSLMTCHKHLTNTDTFFRWAMSHGYMPDGTSPMKGLAPSKRLVKKHVVRRQPFTDEQLVTILGSPEFVNQRHERPERYWLILLLLFQICRREEAAQLYLRDIGESDGVTYLNITDKEPDQTLKNEGSRRKVPLHSSLIELGFLDYVHGIEAHGHKRLFPQLTRKGNNGYGDPVGKWFSRMVTDLGLTDPALVIHSLRHGGITKLHSAGVPVNIVETLTGHAAGNVHGQYVHRELISMKTLRDGLEKLEYPEVVKSLMK